MSVVSRITDLAAAVRDKINAMTPRLVPPGGAAGQVLSKTSGADNDFTWQTPAVGSAAENHGLGIALRNNHFLF